MEIFLDHVIFKYCIKKRCCWFEKMSCHNTLWLRFLCFKYKGLVGFTFLYVSLFLPKGRVYILLLKQ